MGDNRSRSLVSRLHAGVGSIRFRLTTIYSLLLFGLAAIVVGGIYAAVARSIDNEPVAQSERAQVILSDQDGELAIQLLDIEKLYVFEREVNERTLNQLRKYAFSALGVLYVGSLGVGWFVAGSVLTPIGRITSVARDIQATDLGRRISLEGPDDELKQLADTFDSMLGRLDEAFESQRHFIHEASHELRNPLAVIRTNVDVALADPDASAEDLRRTGEVVGKSAERMTTLVDDLLLYARHGTRPTRDGLVAVDEIVAGLADEFAVSAEARNVKLECESPIGLRVQGDEPAVRRALANLLANAIRLAPVGSTICVSAEQGPDATVVLSVADEGPGIAPELHDLVFQRFWRGHDAQSKEPRSGLGLAVVRQIAEAHNGDVQLESVPGGGSTFRIILPAEQKDPR